MKLNNTTRFHGRDLRKFLRAGLEARGVEIKGYFVRIRYRRGDHNISGYGYYHCKSLVLTLPRQEAALSPSQIKRLAQVLHHEIDHNLGLKHKDMCRFEGLPVSWSEGFKIGLRPLPTKKTMAARVAERERYARDKVAELEGRIKALQTRLSKWKQTVRYYDNKKKKAAAPPGQPCNTVTSTSESYPTVV